MLWKGVTVSEQRQRFIEYYLQNFFSISELAERFGTEQFLFMVEAEPLTIKLLIVQLPVIPVIGSNNDDFNKCLACIVGIAPVG